MDWAAQIMRRCAALGALSCLPDHICRTYLTAEHAQCNRRVGAWLEAAGLECRQDAVGNLWGRLPAARQAGPADATPSLIVGSHLDTVPNAGKYDGILGVLLGLAVAAKLRRSAVELPFHLDVVGFGDEEGVRFGATLLGSRAAAGTWEPRWLALKDRDGISLEQALLAFGGDPSAVAACSRAGEPLLGYLEVHIEQGPVLDRTAQPLGVVTHIAGTKRFRLEVLGQAGHAGTVPMAMRRDALAAAAEIVLLVERVAQRRQVVATVGDLACQPGAANVIPGRCALTIDLRAGDDAGRDRAVAELQAEAARMLGARNLRGNWVEIHAAGAVACADGMQALLGQALEAMALPAPKLMSGAGHDAMAMAAVTDVGMLFVRCADGISHHPDERVSVDDVALAMQALERAILALGQQARPAQGDSDK